MTSKAVLWTYPLALDLEIDPRDGGAILRTANNQTWIEGADEMRVIELLAGVGSSEARSAVRLKIAGSDSGGETRCVALLLRLDHLELLARNLSSRRRLLASCVPMRPKACRSAHPRGPSIFRRTSSRARGT
jgi:hypothetical protein